MDAKKTLEKQLQLLSELSNEKGLPVSDICLLTRAMCVVARQLQNLTGADIEDRIIGDITDAIKRSLEHSRFAQDFSENAE